MRVFLLLLLAGLPAWTVGAESPATAKPKPTLEQQAALDHAQMLKLFANLPPGTVVVHDQPYVENMQASVHPGSAQNLDLYVPAGAGSFPLVIYIHGGGWYGGNKDVFGATLANKFVPDGFAVASLNYRLTMDAPFPAQLRDSESAISWLRKHAAAHHLDPDRFGLIGHSAGAQISAFIAATGSTTQFADAAEGPVNVQAACCISGPYDLDRVRGNWPLKSFLYRDSFNRQFFGADYSTERAQAASPFSYVHAGMPPLLIVHATHDHDVPFGLAQAFVAKVKAAGNDVTLWIDPLRGHTDILFGPAIDEAKKFFERVLRPAKT